MKKLILITLFSIGIIGMNAQAKFDLGDCNCTGSLTTWNAPSGLFTIKYKDCGDGFIQMVSFDWKGNGFPMGWITAMHGFNEFFNQFPGVYKGFRMPANCLQWTETGKIWVVGENQFTPTYTIALCDNINGDLVDCCELTEDEARGAIQYIFQSPDQQCESNSGNKCFKLCGYAD